MKPSRLLKANTSGLTLASLGAGAPSYGDKEVAQVLRLVASQSDDINTQLSIIGRALVLGAQVNGIPRYVLDREIDKLWADAQQPGSVLKGN